MRTHETTTDGHLRKKVVITRGAGGWQVRVEHDNEVVRTSTYTDWHRVERAVRVADTPAITPERHSTNR